MTEQARPKHHRYRRYSKSLQLLYQSKKNRAYTGVALTIFAVAFFTFFTIRPTLTTIASLLKEIEDQKVIAEQLEDKIESLNRAQEEYQKIEDKLYLIQEAYPDKPNFSTLVKQIEMLASVNSLPLQNLSFSEVKIKQAEDEKDQNAQTEIKEISFQLKTNGNYEQLMIFLSDLYHFRRVLGINDYTVNRISSTERDSLSLDLTLKAYYFQ